MSDNGSIDVVVQAPMRSLGGDFDVRRALPTRHRRMVGPFVFLDQMGPTRLEPGRGLDVRPHPHIGLATVTYLFEGELLHRDSLGCVQPIQPGAVNWMTAGRGIVHSERTPLELRPDGPALSGLQLWVALPQADEEKAPSFVHHAAASLPVVSDEGRTLRVILGAFEGERSPVRTCSPMTYVDAQLDAGARLPFGTDDEERAFYLMDGEVSLEPDEGGVFGPGELVVLRAGAPVTLRARKPTRLVLIGGAVLDGPRFIRWNFVSSSLERIAQAAEDWDAQRIGQVPGESEFIPLPPDLRRVVSYP